MMDGVDPSTGQRSAPPTRTRRCAGSTSRSRPRSRSRCSTPSATPTPVPRSSRRTTRRWRRVVDWIEDHAHTRYRVNGEVRIVDAEGTIGAVPSARQPGARPAAPHPCRDPEPGHVARRAVARAGWPHDQTRPTHPLRALPRGSAGGADPAPRRAWLEPVNGIAEIADIRPEVLAEFSTRTRTSTRASSTRSTASSRRSAGRRPRGSGGSWNATR